MKGIIRIGDKTTRSGTTLSGSVDIIVSGLARTVIVREHPAFHDYGVPVAFHGHRFAWACALISQ